MAQDWQVVQEALMTYFMVHMLASLCLHCGKRTGYMSQSKQGGAVLETSNLWFGCLSHQGCTLASIESGCMDINMLCSMYTYGHICKNIYTSFIFLSIFSEVGFPEDNRSLVAGDFFSSEKERGSEACCAQSSCSHAGFQTP